MAKLLDEVEGGIGSAAFKARDSGLFGTRAFGDVGLCETPFDARFDHGVFERVFDLKSVITFSVLGVLHPFFVDFDHVDPAGLFKFWGYTFIDVHTMYISYTLYLYKKLV